MKPAHLDLTQLNRDYIPEHWRPAPGTWDGYIFRPEGGPPEIVVTDAGPEPDREPADVRVTAPAAWLLIPVCSAVVLAGGLVFIAGRLIWGGIKALIGGHLA